MHYPITNQLLLLFNAPAYAGCDISWLSEVCYGWCRTILSGYKKTPNQLPYFLLRRAQPVTAVM